MREFFSSAVPLTIMSINILLLIAKLYITFSNFRVKNPPAMGNAPFLSSAKRSQAKMLIK